MNIQSTIATMTIEEKVGQMFMLAFAGDQLDAARVLMEEHLVGAAYIGDENVPTARAAIKLDQHPAIFRPQYATGDSTVARRRSRGRLVGDDRRKRHGTGQYGGRRDGRSAMRLRYVPASLPKRCRRLA